MSGCVNAARVKLALWDAFHGTGQPVLAGYANDTTGTTIYGRNSVQHAVKATGGNCPGDPWRTLGSFLYSSNAIVPDYATFPYTGLQPLAAKTVSGGGIYVALDAGEGFTYTIAFKAGSKTSSAQGSAPNTAATVKVPAGFGAGTATIVLRAETNPERTSTVNLDLASGQATVGGSTVNLSGATNKPLVCKKGHHSTKKKPCRKK